MKEKMKVQSSSPFFDEKSLRRILKDVEAALRSGHLTDGPNVKEFEQQFAEYVGVKHAVAVNSGTSALEIPLRFFGLKGREVIVPTNTFVATPNTVLFAGGRPVFADIREDSLCIDPKDVRRKISKKTAGIVVVHIAGLVCPQMKELAEICEDRGLFLLEDAAHAHGALFEGKKTGTLGDAGAFSFYPTKVMTSGEGGMITTDDSGLAEMALMMRTHGQNAKREMVVLGHNWRMSEMAAIIGRHQLENLERFVVKRNEIARLYEKCLGDVDGIELFRVPVNIRHSYYKYPVKLSDEVDRDELAVVLKEKYGIETGNVYDPPCHLHSFYRENFRTGLGDLPVSERVLRKVLCLPMHCGMSKRDVEYVSEVLRKSIS